MQAGVHGVIGAVSSYIYSNQQAGSICALAIYLATCISRIKPTSLDGRLGYTPVDPVINAKACGSRLKASDGVSIPSLPLFAFGLYTAHVGLYPVRHCPFGPRRGRATRLRKVQESSSRSSVSQEGCQVFRAVSQATYQSQQLHPTTWSPKANP